MHNNAQVPVARANEPTSRGAIGQFTRRYPSAFLHKNAQFHLLGSQMAILPNQPNTPLSPTSKNSYTPSNHLNLPLRPLLALR